MSKASGKSWTPSTQTSPPLRARPAQSTVDCHQYHMLGMFTSTCSYTTDSACHAVNQLMCVCAKTLVARA
eukprot:m.125565 g.125565  ORF g.125565 m.125565 type:complete len:70 (+) comp37877_c0_seq23:1557-1766(+)